MSSVNGVRFYDVPDGPDGWDAAMAVRAWRMLNTIRIFEEKSVDIYKQGLMGGSLHSSIGQEAVAVGVCMHLNRDDYMTMTYRGRGQALAKGASPYRLFAEMLGRRDGYCKGKGGPMHIASPEEGIVGANGIVGAGIPIAVGAALSARTQRTSRVAVAFFGDGATNQGAFHEALNLAAVLALPVIFVCENNLYAEMTPIRESVRNEHLAERGAAYRIPSVAVDGNDVRAVSGAAREAVARAREGGGPSFIEAKTYRLAGHMYGDTESYRTKTEVDEWWRKDPLLQFGRCCDRFGWMSAADRAAMTADIAGELERALQQALLSDEPETEELHRDVI